jgi:hypothetical protein
VNSILSSRIFDTRELILGKILIPCTPILPVVFAFHRLKTNKTVMAIPHFRVRAMARADRIPLGDENLRLGGSEAVEHRHTELE